jgi:hypothetical protein
VGALFDPEALVERWRGREGEEPLLGAAGGGAGADSGGAWDDLKGLVYRSLGEGGA